MSDTHASVLFVCLGNICRSPTGEGVFRHFVQEHGAEGRIRIDSAGTISHHAGEGADPRMRAAASQRGYDLTSRSRKICPEDFETFDLIVAMDRENQRDLERQRSSTARAEIRLLSDFLGPRAPRDVPDPYYGGASGFETVLDLIEDACPALLRRLLDDEGAPLAP